MTPKEVQLSEIRQQIQNWRKDVIECQKRAAQARESAEQSDREAAHAEEMVLRWESVHDAVRFGLVPYLDGCKGPEEVPF